MDSKDQKDTSVPPTEITTDASKEGNLSSDSKRASDDKNFDLKKLSKLLSSIVKQERETAAFTTPTTTTTATLPTTTHMEDPKELLTQLINILPPATLENMENRSEILRKLQQLSLSFAAPTTQPFDTPPATPQQATQDKIESPPSFIGG
jgi:hypothetical protein